MSIISQLLRGQITFGTAAKDIESWFAKDLFAPAVPALKQAAGNAVALGDTALGGLLATGTLAVEAAANTALTTALGPGATALTPGVDAAITQISATLKAAIDAEAAAIRAGLMPPASVGAQSAGNAGATQALNTGARLPGLVAGLAGVFAAPT